ncbi:MAG: HipA N-terminal domain-containing protein [Campylobacterota bacterium]|nr:HipA N-terminal domain-containing protein [Campylobacterota bacterium]
MIQVEILDSGVKAGTLTYDDEKYIFTYDDIFLQIRDTTAISLTIPKQKEPFISNTLHPFFSGLLAEGSLKELQCKKLKIDENDDFKRLIYTAKDDTIGTITIGNIL